MFFQETNAGTGANTGPFASPSNDGSFIKSAGAAAAQSIKPDVLIEGLKAVENQAKTMASTVFGQYGTVSRTIQKSLIESFDQTVKIGASLEDNVNIYKAISTSLQRNNYLTSLQLENLVTLQKSTNMTAEEIGAMVTGFQDMGQGTDAAIEKTSDLAKVARSYGLNVSQFLKTTGDNLKLVNAYGFQNGVEGLGRMVARAQALRMDFSKITGLAAELLSPEKAIDLAAEMQILGGAVGDLADPFKLMYMAENDMEGLQNAVVDTAKSAVMFNQETGEFKITGVEMRRLRAQADALNMSYEDLANTAVKAAKEQEVMSRLEFTGLDEKQKQLIANLGEINKNGEVSLTFPGLDGVTKTITDFTNISADDQKAIEEFQKNANKSDREIAESQLSVLQRQNAILLDIQTAGLRAGGYATGEVGTIGEDLESLMIAVANATGEETTKTIKDFVETGKLTTVLGDFVTGSENLGTSLTNAVTSFETSLTNVLTALPGEIRKGLTIDPEVPEGTSTVTRQMNEYAESLVGLTIQTERFTTAISTYAGNLGTTTETMDAVFPPGSIDVVTGPAGNFKLNSADYFGIATTNDPHHKNNSNQGTIEQKITFGNEMRLKIDVTGNNVDFNNPEVIAGIQNAVKNRLSNSLSQPTYMG